MNRRFRWAAVSISALSTIGCSGIPRLDATGTVAGYAISGPVDSTIARDYLEGRSLPEELERARWFHLDSGTMPTRKELADLSSRYSPDAATLLFIEALNAQPEAQKMRQRFETELAYVKQVGVDAAR